ncbi:MAG: hypothetical protein KJ025_11030 [Burkholderiales bacterium]|nr:hypothetical protein [Burkholderiales bacterium]
MALSANDMLADVAGWQRMLDRHAELFAELVAGARIGILPREATGFAPGRQPAAWREARFGPAGAPMLAWEAADGRMRAACERVGGFADALADFLLLADGQSIAEAYAALDGDALGRLKRRIRRGDVMLCTFRTRAELAAAGYEDFLDSLGLAFMGACR